MYIIAENRFTLHIDSSIMMDMKWDYKQSEGK